MTLEEIWEAFQSYNGEGSKNFQMDECRVQFYKGAMEIPLIAFHPNEVFDLGEERVSELSEILAEFGHELDCVEEGHNYKINRIEDQQYLGRITSEALKLHAERIKEFGWDTFRKIAEFSLAERLET